MDVVTRLAARGYGRGLQRARGNSGTGASWRRRSLVPALPLRERTPHLDPKARGALFRLTTRYTIAHMTRAVMEGVVLE